MTTPSDPRRRPTINDVAVAAGVSSATVSRVLNGANWVAAETRAAVEKAVAETGYTVNHSARSLATGRTNSVAFLITDPQQTLFSDPTFARILNHASKVLARRKTTLVLLIAGTEEERATVAQYVKSGHVDGVMLFSSHESDPFLEDLLRAGVPTIASGVPLGYQDKMPSVAVDEAGSAETMVSYLHSAGYKRVAHIAGPADTPGGRFRAEGYKKATKHSNPDDWIATGDWSKESGRRAMAELLTRGLELDAVFAASDSMARGALEALNEHGLAVPGDVAIAGFDDSGIAEQVTPPLTTMRQPWEQLSEHMVELLLEAISGRPMRHITLPTQLVIREST